MPVAAVAVMAVASAYSANQQKKAASQGAKSASNAAQMQVDEQRRQFDLTRADQAPWLQAGSTALGQQQAFLNGDMSGWNKSADYLGALQGGTQALDRSAAARGSLFSGGQLADLQNLGQRTAQQYMGNYYDRLAGLSRTGSQTASGLGQLGMQMAGNIGNAYGNAAQQRASSYQQAANANSQMAGSLANGANQLIGYYYGNH